MTIEWTPKEKEGSIKRQEYLLQMSTLAGYGNDIEAYIDSLKKSQPELQPIKIPVYTSADYVLSYLFPQNTARKMNKRKK